MKAETVFRSRANGKGLNLFFPKWLEKKIGWKIKIVKHEAIPNALTFSARVIETGCNNLHAKYRKYSSILNVDPFRYSITNKEI